MSLRKKAVLAVLGLAVASGIALSPLVRAVASVVASAVWGA